MSGFRFSLLLVIALGLALPTGPAEAETLTCTHITTLPITISTAGIYCLAGDLSTTVGVAGSFSPGGNPAILITAVDVVLDLNGHSLSGVHGLSRISVRSRENVTVRNGTVRSFSTGVWVGSARSEDRGHIVESLRIESYVDYGVLVLHANKAIVRNNLILSGESSESVSSTGSEFASCTTTSRRAMCWPSKTVALSR